jgi:hypothetical protein
VVLPIQNTMKHAALTDSWVGQQQKVIWTHQLILMELCEPEKWPESNCNPEVQNDLPPQWRTSVTTKIIKSSRWYDSWYVSKNPKQVMQHQGNWMLNQAPTWLITYWKNREQMFFESMHYLFFDDHQQTTCTTTDDRRRPPPSSWQQQEE